MYSNYISNLLLLFYEYNIDFTILKLAKILVASLVRNDAELSKFLLKDKRFGLPVILKCCDILDSRRLLNQVEKKLHKIKNKTKISKNKTFIYNLKCLNEGVNMSLNKSKIKFIKNNWIVNIPKNELELMALIYPKKNWKSLIDLFHLHPSDFKLEWFTKYIFCNEYPEGSIIDICKKLDKNNIEEVNNIYKLPYDFLRLKFKPLLSNNILDFVFDYTPLKDILKRWDEIKTPNNVNKIVGRILNEDNIDMPYGELMKRIQNFKENNYNNIVNALINIAESKLGNYKLEIEQPVVVFGDASSSMQIAIKTSSIITSILTKLCDAKMHLFRGYDEKIENPPKNVSEVLEILGKFTAGGCTAPAASLYPYYINKEIVKTFVIVSDEEENTSYDGKIFYNDKTGSFAEIYKKYRTEVYPAKLVFVSFLRSTIYGCMVRHLKEIIPDIDKDIIQFTFSSTNPDLRKLDELLNVLSIDTLYYEEKCNNINNSINDISKEILFNETNISKLLSNNIDVDEIFITI
jgi:hypothetical protein